MEDNTIHIVGILRDSKTNEFISYTSIPKSKSLKQAQKLVDDWNETSHRDSTYTLSQDKDLIDVIRSINKEPKEVFLQQEIEALDSVISDLEYERSNLQGIQDRRAEQEI
jgi:hypothetical protein